MTFFEGLAPNHVLNDYYSVFSGKIFGDWLDTFQPQIVHVFHLMGLGLSLIEECRRREIPVFVQMMDYWFLCPTVQLLRHDGSLCDGPETEACLECLAPNDYGYQTLSIFSKEKSFVEAPEPAAGLQSTNLAGKLAEREALRARPKFIRSMLDGVTGLVAPSVFLRDFFLKHGYRKEQMRHLPYGVDLPEGRLRSLPVNGEGTVTFGFFGSVNPQKGLEILISAFRDSRCDRFQLVVRGNMSHFPKYAKRIRAFAEVDPRIQFLGPFAHEGLAEALSSIDVLVVPSVWYENTPFVVLEAFAAGRPVICSDLGGLSELVEDKVNGRLFRPGDPGDLMNILKDFEEDEEMLERLASGIRPVRTLEDNMQEFLELWESSLAPTGGSS